MIERPPSTNHAAWDRWIRAALLALAVAPFIATLAFGFVYDDTTIVRTNPRIRGWSSLLKLWTEPYWGPDGGSGSGLYRPLHMAAIAALWNATNHAPIWFHLFIVVLHALATLLVFRLLTRGVSVGAAAIGAAWFAVHPVHVEAVANVANSSEIMVTLFTGVLALLLTRAIERPDDDSQSSLGVAALAGLVYLAACLTKESGFVAPAIAASFAWGWRRPTPAPLTLSDVIRRWRPAVIACAVSLIAVSIARIAVLGAFVRGSMVAPGLYGLSRMERIWSMLSLGPLIARLLLWPGNLNPHYGPSYIAGRGQPTTSAMLTIGVIVVLIVLSVRRARRGDSRLLAALAWMLIAFLPASNLLSATGQILSERTLYGASVGAAMLIALAADAVLSRAAVSTASGYRGDRALVGGVAVLVVGMFALDSWTGVGAWRSHNALFHQMVTADSASYRGRWLLGLDARLRNDTTAALEWLGQAYALYPHDRQLLIDYSETLMQHGEPREAAAVALRLMDWPELRRRPEAVALYLNAVERGYGPDSALAASRRLRAYAPDAAIPQRIAR